MECQADDLAAGPVAACVEEPCLVALRESEAAEPSLEGDQAGDLEAGQEADLQAWLCS